MIKGYRGTDGDIEPVEFECETLDSSKKTTTGERMYENTHFATEEQAWNSINGAWEAGVAISSHRLKDAEATVVTLTKKLADDILKAQESKGKYLAWLLRHNKVESPPE